MQQWVVRDRLNGVGGVRLRVHLVDHRQTVRFDDETGRLLNKSDQEAQDKLDSVLEQIRAEPHSKNVYVDVDILNSRGEAIIMASAELRGLRMCCVSTRSFDLTSAPSTAPKVGRDPYEGSSELDYSTGEEEEYRREYYRDGPVHYGEDPYSGYTLDGEYIEADYWDPWEGLNDTDGLDGEVEMAEAWLADLLLHGMVMGRSA